MADQTDTTATAASAPIAAPAASVAVSSAPAAEAAPVAASPSSYGVQTPADAPPAAAPTATAEPPVAAAIPPTVIGAEPKIPEIKTPEGEKPPEPKKDEASQSDAPAPLPAYEAWTLPEGVTLDEAKATEFNKLLGEFQAGSKAEQAAVQAFGQELIDRHVSELKSALARKDETYQQAWVKQTEDWKQAFVNDPEIGLNRQETTVATANEFIATHGGTPEQQAEFRSLMQTTGLGNHPAMIRLLANAKNSAAFGAPQPLAGTPPTEKVSRSQKYYGKKTA